MSSGRRSAARTETSIGEPSAVTNDQRTTAVRMSMDSAAAES